MVTPHSQSVKRNFYGASVTREKFREVKDARRANHRKKVALRRLEAANMLHRKFWQSTLDYKFSWTKWFALAFQRVFLGRH